MPTYDSNIMKVPKPSAPSYTVNPKPTASYTIVAKGTRPATTKVPKPYLEPLAILTEDSVEILMENTIVLTVQGAL